MCNVETRCKSGKYVRFQKYFRALHCPIRWMIIRAIGNEERGTNEIFEELRKMKMKISRTGLYYHLSELKKAGIIALAGYREVGGGAPEKIWRLETKEIKINLLTDL